MIDNTIKAEWTNADALDLQPTYNQLATDCTKCNEYDNAEKTCPYYCEVRHSTEDGLQVETYCQKRKLPSAQSDSKESSFTHKALDLIERQAAIDLVRDVCNAVMSGCESLHDPETKDEVYEDIREVDAILKCNKEVRIALRNMPSAQQDCTDCPEYDSETKSCPKYCDVIRRTLEEAKLEPEPHSVRRVYQAGYADGFEAGRKAGAQEWIPCKVRLPEEYGEYRITWVTSASKKRFIGDSEYEVTSVWDEEQKGFKGEWLLDDYIKNYPDVKVIAWKPLEEPYKEGES